MSKFLSPLLLSVLIFAACSTRSQEQDEADYVDFLSRLRAEEPYIGFFAAEEAYISQVNKAYLKERRKCFLGVSRSKEEPHEYFESFTAFCIKKKLLKESDRQAWEKVLTILSFELYANMPIFEFETTEVIEHRNLTYASYPNKSLQLDLFLPREPIEMPIPTVVCIHGGGWMVNRRVWFEPWAKYLAAHGIAAVTIDYRMLPAVTVRECVYDSKAAVRWVRANAKTYNLDSNKIGAIGASAGAHLVALLGTSADEPALEGSGGNPDFSTEIHAVVGIATPSINTQSNDWLLDGLGLSTEELKRISPLEHISEASAPLYLIHGNRDEVVPPRNAQEIHDKYLDYGLSVQLNWIEGEGHGFYEGNDRAIRMATEFFIQEFFGD